MLLTPARDQTTLHSWFMCLQHATPRGIAEREEHLIVIDIENDNSAFWQVPEVRTMKANGKHKVLAHINVALAEDHRPYWKANWRQSPPPWMSRYSTFELGHPVQFWNREWQTKVYDLVLKAIRAQFDGVYLAGVGLYTIHTKVRTTAHQDMGQFIRGVSEYAKSQGNESFMIVAENAGELIYDEPARNVLAGVAQTQLLYSTQGERISAPNYSKTRALLTLAKASGLPVYVHDVVRSQEEYEFAIKELRRMGFSPYVTIRK